MTRQENILVKGGRLITMATGRPTCEVGDLLVQGGSIAAILPPGTAVENAVTIEASDMIVLPGFIDTHRHVWQTQLRTSAADWTLFDYLVQMRSIYSAFYTPEDAYLGNLAGALESLDAGITTIVDHCHLINSPAHSDALVQGLEDSGIRGVFCYGFFVNPTHHPFLQEDSPGWRYDDARRIRQQRLASDNAMILFGVSPQEPEALPPNILHHEIGLARELGARTISMHVAMGNYDGGNRVVQRLHDAKLLGPDMLFVHGAALTDGELDAIATAGAGLSSTPETEMQMGMGWPVAFRALEHGVRVSIGIDIVSNYAADMLLQARLALQSARALDNHALAATARAPRRLKRSTLDSLRLATLGGAEALHLESRTGSLEPGKAADIILVRTDGLHMIPSPDAAAGIVYGAGRADIDTVIVDGVVRKRGGKLLHADLDGIKMRLRESAERIAEGHRSVGRSHFEAIWAGILPHLE